MQQKALPLTEIRHPLVMLTCKLCFLSQEKESIAKCITDLKMLAKIEQARPTV